MRCLIITGGTIDCRFAENYISKYEWDFILSADAGMQFCRAADLEPRFIIGDFDSVDRDTYAWFQQKYPDRIITYPAEKNETDTELVVAKAIELGADEITILGATGTRMDHVIGNLQMLLYTLERHVDCRLVDAHNRIRMTDHAMTMKMSDRFGKYVSLIPFGEKVTGLTLRGFAYNVEDFTLIPGITRGLSNELREEEATIELNTGILYVIESVD